MRRSTRQLSATGRKVIGVCPGGVGAFEDDLVTSAGPTGRKALAALPALARMKLQVRSPVSKRSEIKDFLKFDIKPDITSAVHMAVE